MIRGEHWRDRVLSTSQQHQTKSGAVAPAPEAGSESFSEPASDHLWDCRYPSVLMGRSCAREVSAPLLAGRERSSAPNQPKATALLAFRPAEIPALFGFSEELGREAGASECGSSFSFESTCMSNFVRASERLSI